jgi:iron complex transport system ATP-binding protein
LALLLQGAPTPPGFCVADLVSAGRAPHRGWLRRWSAEDATAVEAALERCRLCDARDRPLDTLSGGQQRRCWFGMALAQDTPILLLDEPTTFLDPAAQIALLDIVRALNHESGRTIVMVLHDLNLAARYADHLIVMRQGEVVAAGPPRAVVTAGMVRAVFGVEADVERDPRTGAPLCVPWALTASVGAEPSGAGAPATDPRDPAAAGGERRRGQGAIAR